jgi:hypothetical protein
MVTVGTWEWEPTPDKIIRGEDQQIMEETQPLLGV